MKIIKNALLFLSIAALILTFDGCSHIQNRTGGVGLDRDSKAEKLINSYKYHIASKKSSNKMVLGDSLPYALHYEASKKIGLNLEKYKGKEMDYTVYELKERSQSSPEDGINAFVFFNEGDEIAGAFLVYEGYTPGVVPLSDRSNLKAESLKPEKLTFKDVSGVEILGPWDDSAADKWTEKKAVPQDGLQDFLKLMESSKPIKGEFKNGPEYKEYMVIIYYSNGPVVRARLHLRDGIQRLTFDNIQDWTYNPTPELVKYITGK